MVSHRSTGQKRFGYGISAALLGLMASGWGRPPALHAEPAPIFQPHIESMRRALPLGLAMRLPDSLHLPKEFATDTEFFVQYFPSENPRRFLVSVSTCDRQPVACLLTSFTTERYDDPSAQWEFQRHQTTGFPITLSPTVQGYLLEGADHQPPLAFSSVMWQQETMIYTVTFPSTARQNLLFLAAAVANGGPIYPQRVPTPQPEPWFLDSTP